MRLLIEGDFINFGPISHSAVHKNSTTKDWFMRAVLGYYSRVATIKFSFGELKVWLLFEGGYHLNKYSTLPDYMHSGQIFDIKLTYRAYE